VSAISVQRFANSSITLFTAANLTGSNLTVYTGTMGAVTGTPSGTTASTSNATVLDAYANNSYERTGTITIGLNDCNVTGGIKSMVFGTNYICYQMEFSSKIPKDATKVMTLSGKATWGRL
jgi:hypothetical protein